jgi:hypothetical protein
MIHNLSGLFDEKSNSQLRDQPLVDLPLDQPFDDQEVDLQIDKSLLIIIIINP